MEFIPLTEMDRRLFGDVMRSSVEGVGGAIQLGDPKGPFQCALTFGTHLKEGRVAGLALERLLGTENLIHAGVGLLIVCSFPKGFQLAIDTDDREVWKGLRAYPGSPDGNRLPQNLSGTNDYVLQRVAAIRDLFIRRGVRNLLDIHATDGPSTPGYLGCAGPHELHSWLIPFLGVDHYFTDVGTVQLEQGTKTFTFSAASGAEIGSEIEMGQTGTQEARENCLRLVQQWGGCIGAIKTRPEKLKDNQTGYRMVASYMAPSADYQVADVRLLDDLAFVKAGEPILVNAKTGQAIPATSDQFLTWGPSDAILAPEDLPTEIFFGCVKL